MISLRTNQITVNIKKKILYHNLNLNMQGGEIWGILGRNGSGKSTLLHTLAGINKPIQGEIFLHNKNIIELSQRSIAKKIALLLQEYRDIFDYSVLKTILTGRFPHLSTWQKENLTDHQIANDAITLMDLTLLAKQSINSLSGGERRRVAIACVLTQTPDIYLLDEPLNQLDPNYQINVLNHFQSLARINNKLVIMTLHDINHAIKFCTHVLLLLDDQQYLTGTTVELINEDTIKALYNHSFKKFIINNQEFWLAT
jgi:iron complex transport system ATP-binding protein